VCVCVCVCVFVCVCVCVCLCACEEYLPRKGNSELQSLGFVKWFLILLVLNVILW